MRGRMCVVLICNVCVRVGVQQVEYSAINLAYAYATTSGGNGKMDSPYGTDARSGTAARRFR